MANGTQKAGLFEFIVGGFISALGVALIPVTGGASASLVGVGNMISIGGALTFVMGTIFKPKEIDQPKYDSPTYGFSQFENRAKGDTAIPVVYSNDPAAAEPGHRIAPIFVNASVTPRGYEAAEYRRTKGTRGQGVSCLMVVAEGPIVGIDDVRVNDEPLWAQKTVKAQGTGSKKTFEFTVRRADLGSLQVTVAGVSKGWTSARVTEMLSSASRHGTAATTQTIFTFVLPDYNAGQQRIDDSGEVRFYLGPTAVAGTLLANEDTAELRPIAWQSAPNTLTVWTQEPIPTGKALWISVPIRKLDGLKATANSSDGTLKLIFGTAPASGAEIVAKLRTVNLRGVRVEYRYGGAHQVPIDGFDSVRNSVGVNQELTWAAGGAYTERTTDEPVDDVTIDIAALAGIFHRSDEDGSLSPRSVEFEIGWRPYGETKPILLREPGDGPSAKTRLKFEVSGMSTASMFWSFSVRRLLESWCEDHPNDSTAAAELVKLARRQRLVISVRRVTPPPAGEFVQDDITWTSYAKVVHERLSYPGVALLAFHGVASSKLQGSLPRVTCRVQGKADVEVYSGGAWTASPTAQANPVWAAVDLITARRYGGGEQFTKSANIDTTSAVLAAAWCDLTISDGKGGTEAQNVIDMVLDTRGDLMEQVARLLMPARVVPVLRGSVWAFVIDQAVTLSTVPTINDDGTSGVTLKDSLSFAHQPQTSRMTEVQLSYLDRADDFEHNEVWVATNDPTTDRRIERVTADGVTRATQATRYARWIHAKASFQGPNCQWAMIPIGLRIQAGDVVRLESTRLGVQTYARVMRATLESTDNIIIGIEASQYVPACYGQNLAAQIVTGPRRPTPLALPAPTTTSAGGPLFAVGRLAASIRRAA